MPEKIVNSNQKLMSRVLCTAQDDPTEALDPVEETLDKVALFAERPVDGLLGFSDRVLLDGGHDHLRAGLGAPEIAGPAQPEQPFHGAKDLIDPEPPLRYQAVEVLL